MIVIDTSAVVAIVLQEPTANALIACIGAAKARSISVVNYVEAATVLADRMSDTAEGAVARMDQFLALADIELVPVDQDQAREAAKARIRFGKGFGHPARLNFGDTFAYALAKQRRAPLLFVGDDFIHTDVESALA